MIDYTIFPLGIRVATDKENDKWAIKNTFEKDIRVTVVLKPNYWLALPFGMLVEDKKPRVLVEVEE